MFDFADQVVVVTGGAGNLGAALARARYGAGARVADVILFRASDPARDISGAAVPVYGRG